LGTQIKKAVQEFEGDLEARKCGNCGETCDVKPKAEAMEKMRTGGAQPPVVEQPGTVDGSSDVARMKADLVEAERILRQQGDDKTADRLAATITAAGEA